jgi:hypothetical protein
MVVEIHGVWIDFLIVFFLVLIKESDRDKREVRFNHAVRGKRCWQEKHSSRHHNSHILFVYLIAIENLSLSRGIVHTGKNSAGDARIHTYNCLSFVIASQDGIRKGYPTP